MSMIPVPLLEMDNLELIARRDRTGIVHGASLIVRRGEICALVGESGSGKTLISRATIGLLPPGIAVAGGAIRFDGVDLAALDERGWRKLRGSRIGLIFQEPMVSLNPAMRIGAQMAEAYRLHRHVSASEARSVAIDMLARFRVPDPAACLDRHPHQFSGGMRQRIMLAAVMMLEPDLLIADEPTTALDALVQQDVLDTMVEVVREKGTAVLLVTHDLGVVARYADTACVINRGRVEESGPARHILASPTTAYTRRLVAAMPCSRPDAGREQAFEPVIAAEGVTLSYPVPSAHLFARARRKVVVEDADLHVGRGEIVGLVGESGSGKSSLGRALLRLSPIDRGTIRFGGRSIEGLDEAAFRPMRRQMQLVFQDPHSALNPRLTVGATVAAAFDCGARAERMERVAHLLAEVGLEPDHAARLPHELSGGQRQRVCIARALACDPAFIVADEAVAALDASVQARILDLFLKLRDDRGFGCLFISHDLAVVRSICDRVIVMKDGRIVESGQTGALLATPTQDYTRRLIAAFPSLDVASASH